jgi:SAM-dependent methyltransferase
MSFVALSRGQWANAPHRSMTYCELGCGQGFTTNLLAAANPHIQFYANDFNPAHTAGARRLAKQAGLTNVNFYDDTFAEFLDRPHLPESFDTIALHGVYSWVTAEVRDEIIAFIKRKLAPGGLVYVSYNALPGWAGFMPLRRLLVDHASTQGSHVSHRIDEALVFIRQMAKLDALYFKQNSKISERLDKMIPMSRNYLAHEYFNKEWTPFYFEDIVTALASAKLTFVGSSNLLDHYDEISLTPEQANFLAQEENLVRRESLRDFMTDEQFRTDIFVKGSRQHTFKSGAAVWLTTRFALTKHKQLISSKITGRRKGLELHPEIRDPILNALSKSPLSVRQLLGEPEVGTIGWERLTQALMLLVGAGHICPCLSVEDEGIRAEACTAFNKAVCIHAEDNDDMHFLASPVSGSAIAASRYEQLFVSAIFEGHDSPDAWANFAWNILKPQGHRVLKDGAISETAEADVVELLRIAEIFGEYLLPLLRYHSIVPSLAESRQEQT